MTQRRLIVPGADRAKVLLQNLSDRVTLLERGAVLLGQVSVASGFSVGGVGVQIEDTGGGHRRVVFRNPASGPLVDSFTIQAATLIGAVLADGATYFGVGFSVNHPSTGIYTITYATPYPTYSVGFALPIAFSISGQNTFVGYNANSPASITFEFRDAAGALTDIGFIFTVDGA